MFLGLGPGGLRIPHFSALVPKQCLSGSSHGGKGHQGPVFSAHPPYGKDDMTSLLGGSGGEIAFIILTVLSSLIFALHYFIKITRSYGQPDDYHVTTAFSDLTRSIDESK